MPVRWDSVLVRAVSRELDERLRGLRCRAYQLDRSTRGVWLFFDALCVEMRLAPASGVVLLHEAVDPHTGSTPLSADMLGVSSPPDERRFTISFRRKRGRSRHLDLVIEWAPNRRNAVMLTPTDRRVQDCLPFRGPGADRTHRGGVYIEPDPPGRTGLAGDLSLTDWVALAEDPGRLLSTVAWTSPVNLDALRADPEQGFGAWKAIATESRTEPGLLTTPRGRQPYPMPLPGLAFQPTTDLLEAIAKMGPEAAYPVDPDAVERLDRRRLMLDREIKSLRRELQRTPDPAATRANGDLILSRLSMLKRGMAEAHLPDFEGGTTIVVLDPTLEPHENADRFYREAARAARARETLPERIEGLELQIERLEALRVRIESGEASAEELPRFPHPPRGKKKGEPESRPYRVFHSSGGLEIRVGRGARFNDDLTFRHARPNDVWLHARDSAGAHVILRWTSGDAPPARDLEEAAALAALHSRSRHSATVPVDWTRRKYVRKPRGARAGSVLPERVKTVFVSPADAPDPPATSDS